MSNSKNNLIKKTVVTADRPSKFVYVAAAISALGGMLFGYDTGVISGAILFIRKDFLLSPAQVEVVVSCVLVGALLGAIVGGVLADRFGRRRVIIVTAILFAAGAIETALAPSITLLIAGRIIVGTAIGVASFTTPLYISEVAPVNIRGRLVSINQVALTSGIVISYLVDYSLVAVQGWRWMFALATVPAIILAIGMFLLPESPRWLVSRNLIDSAQKVLIRIRGNKDVNVELEDIQKSLAVQSGGWRDLFTPLIRPALIVGVGLAILQQITGINTVIYYAPMIFEFTGIKSASASILATVGVGLVNVVMTVVALVLVDRIGRRPLLLAGLSGMIVGLGVLGLAFFLPGLSGSLGWIAEISLMLYVGAFAVGLGPVFWLLISEIYPLKIRGVAMSIATSANWGANLFVALTFLTLIQATGRSLTFWIYALVGVAAWLFTWFLVPETKGRSLEEIEAHWQAGKHPRTMGQQKPNK
jgi:SP family galactose:H+ symporter-like MFS transporter